jgi:hypothetical protein
MTRLQRYVFYPENLHDALTVRVFADPIVVLRFTGSREKSKRGER